MALTPSTMMPLGTTAPEFTLPDTVSGKDYSLAELTGTKGLLVTFICNHCPFVIHIIDQYTQLLNEYIEQGIGCVAISANDVVSHPDDHPDKMKLMAANQGFKFPYLYDETQSVAKAYDAACTPDFFLFDSQLTCVYRGQFDDSKPGNNKPVTGRDLRQALTNLVAGQPISEQQVPSMGCNIKWKG
ncbi:thioredoxin family protein [Endozoicomonas sp. SM1973]|uniref:Thioredoxin family protein n=1 Tax=Spartinivicinus marinus TaxID=2994442 RepID=A0A853HVJ6_9GAMM|nr:thioredoxin family protein [Spartinivicinus marinus]MCX4025787.1 thioredoxin family protein [Spartinivicinus marinus]NYZ65780.1 thioredoxin family protein [Spartinivicinus marinus]